LVTLFMLLFTFIGTVREHAAALTFFFAYIGVYILSEMFIVLSWDQLSDLDQLRNGYIWMWLCSIISLSFAGIIWGTQDVEEDVVG